MKETSNISDGFQGGGKEEKKYGRFEDRGFGGGMSGEKEMFEKVVEVNRCAKVVKGGRRFSFSALVVVGDRNGKVGLGFGKANEVSEAVRKGTEAAKKKMEKVALREHTVPHEVLGEFDGARVLLRPASPGTGLIAGGGVRAVIEAAGVKDVLAKSLGSGTPSNVVKAAMDALRQLRTRETIMKLRGRPVRESAKDGKASKKDK